LLFLLAVALAPVEVFSIHEVFGVAHPTQIIDFDCSKRIDAGRSFMIGLGGTEVPFQVLHDGKIAVEAELPPFGEATWKLYTGRAPQQFSHGVRINETPAYYEITNGITGVRIARAGHPGLAPIQGILYRDGTWTATGPNSLESDAKPAGMTVRFIERGPLRVVVEVSYRFDRPDLLYGNKLLIPAGAGFYRSTIEIQAGQPSILIEDDTDTDLRYSLDVYRGLQPDQARYRGHHSTSAENGREADGRQYRLWHERPAMDAFRDLQYRSPVANIPRMAVWDPWVSDSGWYWMLYNSKASSDANLLGIFAGRTSEAIGAPNSGAGISSAGIEFETHRRSPDARVFPRVRIAWAIFIGTKGADLGDPYQVQNIARQMNLHGGITLNKVYRYQSAFADPAGGYVPLFMSRDAVNAVITRVRSDEDYYHRLYDAEPTARPLLDMWRDDSGAKLKELGAGVSNTSRDLLDALVNGDGIYDFRFHYWHGGLEMARAAVWIESALTDDRITAKEAASAKAAAVLYYAVLWDNDFVPMFEGHGLNLGTANMPVQQNQYRDLYALLLRHDSEGPLHRALDNLHLTVADDGAAMGSTHYIGASMGPLLTTLQQLQTAGIADAFRTEPSLTNFAEFYLNLLTPPEPRFGYRKLVSIGDGSTESSELFGQLATGFAAADPALSARLMAAWRKSGAMHSGFHGSTILKIDERLPAENPHLGDATFPGWFTVLRNGWGTRNETSAWLVNGDFYRDHVHEDNGTVVVYALGAPLSIDWGSMYSPQSPGAFMHSLALPESALGFPWDTETTHLDQIGFRWQHPRQEAFESFTASAHVRATYDASGTRGLEKWTRSVYSIHPDESHPIIVIRDSFDPPGTPHVVTLNLMGEPDSQSSPSPCRGFSGAWLIDWELCSLTADPSSTVMRSWSHNWHPDRERSEFLKANGRAFEERQSIFRLRTTGTSTLLLLPRRQDDPRVAAVQSSGAHTVITWETTTVTLDPECYTFADGRKEIVTAFGTQPCQAAGIDVRGGPAEVIVEPAGVAIRAHGAPGRRIVTLPGSWTPDIPTALRDGRWLLDYTGPQPVTIHFAPTRSNQ
jgi:hypothetical protein